MLCYIIRVNETSSILYKEELSTVITNVVISLDNSNYKSENLAVSYIKLEEGF